MGGDHVQPAQITAQFTAQFTAQVKTGHESVEMAADLRNGVLACGRGTPAVAWWTLSIYPEVARPAVHVPTSATPLFYKCVCQGEAA